MLIHDSCVHRAVVIIDERGEPIFDHQRVDIELSDEKQEDDTVTYILTLTPID